MNRKTKRMLLSRCLTNRLSLFNNCLIYLLSSNMQHTITVTSAVSSLEGLTSVCVCVAAVKGDVEAVRFADAQCLAFKGCSVTLH